MGKIVALLVAGWLGLSAIGVVFILSDETPTDAPATVVGCPQEDSCTADYHDGAWHITQVDE